MKTIIKNGAIVTSTDIFMGDLLINDSVISTVAKEINDSADETIDAAGKYVIPGGIDAHTHFQLPVKGTVSADGFESGSKAAVCGGVTTYIDFAHSVKGEPLIEALEKRKKEADGNSYVDYGLHLGISGFDKEVLKQVPEIISQGVPSFKLYMIYAKEGWMSDDAAIFAMLQSVKKYGGLVMVHAENPYIIDYFVDSLVEEGKVQTPWHAKSRPDYVEIEAIKRAIYLTEVTESRLYVVHISTGEGAALLAQAKGRGIQVFGETCPQYLLLTDEIYEREDGHLYVTCPPLRKKPDQAALWKGLSMGAIQVISTDTCTFTRQQKESGKDDFTKLPGGLPGIETLVPIIYSEGVRKGFISLNQWVDYISTTPAKMFGLYPKKGCLSPGSDADVVIFDPEKSVEIKSGNLHYNVDYSPFEGMTIQGWPSITISRGKIIYKEGKFQGKKDWGKFIPRYYAD